jgi:hypothetical protein
MMIKEIKKLGYMVVALLVVVLVLPILSAAPALAAFPSVISLTETEFDSETTNHYVQMPATVDANDLLIVLFANTDTSAVTTPDGWTQLATGSNSADDGVRLSVYYKKAAGDEDGTTVNFSTSPSSRRAAAQVYRISSSSWHGTTPPEISTAATGDSNSPNPSSLDPSGWGTEDTLWIAAAGIANDPGTSGYPSSYTNGVETQGEGSGDDCQLNSARRANATDSENPGSFDLGGSGSEPWVAFTIAVRPAGAPAGPTVTINQAIGQDDPTSSSPINFTVVFSESVTGFATGDVTLSGSAGATTGTVTGGPATYNVAVTGMTDEGTVTASIAAGVANAAADPYAPNAASTSTDDTVTYQIPTDPNPPLAECCGLDVVLVLDSSGSIGDLDDVRDPAKAFVSALLPGTNSLIGVVEFDATVVGTPLDLTDNTTNIGAAIDAIASGGSTNWEAGLTEARLMLENGHSLVTDSYYSSDRDDTSHPDLIIMVSNGEPTTHGYPTSLGSSDPEDIANAVIAANAAKGSTGPIRVIYVGVDSSTDNGERISGGNVGPPPDVTTDAMLADLPGLDDVEDWGDAIAARANVCECGTIILEKQTDPDGDPQFFDIYEYPAVTLVTSLSDNDTYQLNCLAPGTYTFIEDVPDCWYIQAMGISENIDNSILTPNSGNATLILDPGETIHVTYYNTKKGTITVVKQTDPPGSPQEFEITGNAVSGLISDLGPPLESGCIIPDIYSVTEIVPECWELTGIVSTDDNGSTDIPTATATIHLDPGEDVIVTFQDMQWGWIVVEKQTDPPGLPTTFPFDGDLVGALGDGGRLESVCLPPYNTYTVWEVLEKACWELADIQLQGDLHPTGTPSHYDFGAKRVFFELDPGETITATFTNKYEPCPDEPVGEDHGADVGIEVFSVNKFALVAPWIALAVVIIAGGILLARRHRAHS